MSKNSFRLVEHIKSFGQGNVCVAFSGGVDSSVVLKAACEAVKGSGGKVYAVTFSTRLHPQADLEVARKAAAQIGAVHQIVEVNELDNPLILNNPVDRCYLCKKYLFEHLLTFAKENDAALVLEGSNADDMGVYRPGIRAVRELGVKSPLAELGITKAEVREMAVEMGLFVAHRPSTPCLATRLPYDTEISFELLERIDCGENWLREQGFDIVRLRVHGDILRIEIEKEKFGDFLAQAAEITAKMQALGFVYVTLDVEGFRSGSMDIHLRG